MVQVVWLKRDLRVADHRPLYEASQTGPTIAMYVAEPSIWYAGDLAWRHLQFVAESLRDMESRLLALGIPLYTAVAEMEDVLQAVHDAFGAFRLLAHEENGAPNTFARDMRVHRWMGARGLTFLEYQHFAVTRRLASRQQFQQKWEQFMTAPLVPTINHAQAPADEQMMLLTASGILRRGIHFERLQDVPGSLTVFAESQRGGELTAQATFADFLQTRCDRYQFHISKPFESMRSCARISPYLSWGNLSIREAVQRTREAMAIAGPTRKRHLEAFFTRLRWHCHFVQKIEDTPHIADTTIDSAYAAFRVVNEPFFQAWLDGRTGFPAVDAAMRCLQRTGWLHFRSRAMLVSFACNTLLLDWQKPAQALAQLFLDYEPGIHYSQVQMQASTTGIHTIRIYNPVKQSETHDEQGRFIKRFLPELRSLPPQQLHEPWKYVNPEAFGYPLPIVDLLAANRKARDLLWGLRKRPSRTTTGPEQISFDFGTE